MQANQLQSAKVRGKTHFYPLPTPCYIRSMARMVLRSCAVSIALALAGSGVCAQGQQPAAMAAQKSEDNSQQNARIVALLEQLADQARASANLAFAVRAQSQAARLLWAQEPDRARTIYQRAFHSLAPSASSRNRDNLESAEASKTPDGRSSSFAEKRQLRTELLNQIAARDPELAEELARSLADFVESTKNGCGENGARACGSAEGSTPQIQPGLVATRSRLDAERRELLMSAALQVVDRDPQQAISFAQMSVALGISSNLARLLTLMRTVDAERADLLFSNAVARLEQASQVDLADVRTLGSYVVSAVNSGSKQPMSTPLVLRFLNFAFSQIAADDSAAHSGSSQEDSAALYFIGRQLTDLFGRYLPYRLHQLQSYIGDQGAAGYYDEVIDPGALKVSAPADIVREAIAAADPAERDSLYARAAIAWLSQADLKDAQATALRISDTATRDRVLAQIVRRYSYEKQIDDAVGLTRRITDETARVELLAGLSSAARASKDNQRAAELLDEAAACALRAQPTLDRARSLMMIASSFAPFDTTRSFEVLQSAVKAINDLVRQEESKDAPSGLDSRSKASPAFTLDELYAASFDSTLAALAKADFDTALALARQLPGDEASVIAQLAVCGGGLTERSSRKQPTTSDDVESGLNH
ncbi:MAG TPA: hypothetical protein VLG74_16830 [Blastocatellia bacterium]|nr:hypothetical protein [Blastocatellia bacterium]